MTKYPSLEGVVEIRIIRLQLGHEQIGIQQAEIELQYKDGSRIRGVMDYTPDGIHYETLKSEIDLINKKLRKLNVGYWQKKTE